MTGLSAFACNLTAKQAGDPILSETVQHGKIGFAEGFMKGCTGDAQRVCHTSREANEPMDTAAGQIAFSFRFCLTMKVFSDIINMDSEVRKMQFICMPERRQ